MMKLALILLSLFTQVYITESLDHSCRKSPRKIRHGIVKGFKYNAQKRVCVGRVTCDSGYIPTRKFLLARETLLEVCKRGHNNVQSDEASSNFVLLEDENAKNSVYETQTDYGGDYSAENDHEYGTYYDYDYGDYDGSEKEENEERMSTSPSDSSTVTTVTTTDTTPQIPTTITTVTDTTEGSTSSPEITTTSTEESTVAATSTVDPEYEDETPSDYEEYDEENYDDEEEKVDEETEILYRNYEILSNFYKLHYVDLRVLDTSCNPEQFPPPRIDNGYVKEYRTSKNVLLEGREYHEVIYVCEEGYKLAEGSTGHMFCQEHGWMGIQPYCEKDHSVLKSNDTNQEDICDARDYRCHHECRIVDGSPSCICNEGYEPFDAGRRCDDVDECIVDNGGCEHLCINKPGTFMCECPPGFTADGMQCTDNNECTANNGHGPCQDICTNNRGSYVCTCESVKGTVLASDEKSCEAKEDLCGDNNGGCSHTCYSSYGQAFCMCPEGMKLGEDWKNCKESGGEECDSAGHKYDTETQNCVDIDECMDKEIKRCGINGTCVNTDGSYTCVCSSGYEFKEDICKDMNECESEDNPCEERECINLQGSFRCGCQEGFKLNDKQVCVDIDECESASSCKNPLEKCTNSPGSFTCECLDGYEKNVTSCVDIDECSKDNGECEQLCQNTEGSFACECKTGFKIDPDNNKKCLDIDECTEEMGSCAQVCMNTVGSFECSCHKGFKLSVEDSKTCVSLCSLMNCTHECYEGECVCPKNSVLNDDGITCSFQGCSLEDLGEDQSQISCSEVEESQGIYPPETICRSKCSRHTIQIGRLKKKCENGKWIGTNGTCSHPHCPPLKLLHKNVIVEPEDCLSKNQSARARCRISCLPGYRLLGSHSARCRRDSTWKFRGGEPKCIRIEDDPNYTTSEMPPSLSNPTKFTPYIQCPPDIIKDLNDSSDKIQIKIPQPKTNVDWENNVHSTPSWAKSLKMELRRGKTSVAFTAFGEGFDSVSCSLTIHVRDKIIPNVFNCPESFKVHLNRGQEAKQVYWDEPIFTDNVKIIHVMTSKLPGQSLSAGEHVVVYEAGDEDGNKAKCEFIIRVVPHQTKRKLKRRRRKQNWVLCRIGSTGRQIKLLVSRIPRGCRKLPEYKIIN